MNRVTKQVAALAAVSALLVGGVGCGRSASYQEVIDRQEQAKTAATKPTLEKANLARKIKLEEDPNRIGYVYLLGKTGNPFGYYTVKGKISSSGSQLEPEDQVLHPYSGEYIPVDGPQDDGTYGEGDPGIFFFTTEDVYVETTADYFYASQPVATDLKLEKLG